MKTKVAKPVERKKDSTLVLNFDADESSSDWLGYSWIIKLAGEGDEEAKKEIDRMDTASMIEEARE
jgi:hypothetical protein